MSRDSFTAMAFKDTTARQMFSSAGFIRTLEGFLEALRTYGVNEYCLTFSLQADGKQRLELVTHAAELGPQGGATVPEEDRHIKLPRRATVKRPVGTRPPEEEAPLPIPEDRLPDEMFEGTWHFKFSSNLANKLYKFIITADADEGLCELDDADQDEIHGVRLAIAGSALARIQPLKHLPSIWSLIPQLQEKMNASIVFEQDAKKVVLSISEGNVKRRRKNAKGW